MNSTPAPKATEPHDASIAGAGERLEHAHEQIVRADEQLALLSEQVARMERNAARAPSALFRRQSPPGRRALGALIGLLLAACIVVAALALQSFRLHHCRRKIRRLPESKLHFPFKWPRRRQHQRKQRPWLRPHRKTPRRQLPCRQLPQHSPITHNCCKRWRAISQTSSEASCSSRRASKK
jgi:hypothetical protein